MEAIRRLLVAADPLPLPEHCHWNWAHKALRFDPALHRVFSIEIGDQLQGLMWTWIRGYRARLPPDTGQPIVYVDYLEAAPWNTREYTSSPRYRGIGTRLLQAAILLSREKGFQGRAGLHALPQSEHFYAGACGMLNLGADANYQGLAYFEFTSEAAATFVGTGGET